MVTQHRSASPELPCEIWHHVSQFLSDDQLRRMYSVNRTFYQIAMSLRYREMSIGSFYGPDGVGTLKCYLLSNMFYYHVLPIDSGTPNFVQYVRSLKLKPTPLGDLLADASAMASTGTQPTSSRKGIPANRLLARTTDLILRRPTLRQQGEEVRVGHVQMAQKLRDFVAALQQLTNLTIEWDASWGGPPDSFNDDAQLLVTVGWQAYSSTLRTLELTVPLEICERIFSTSLQLNKLERLIFWLEKYYINTDDTMVIRKVLVPFVQRHAQTLKTLAFNSFQNLDMTTFFEGIGYIPHLERLDIQQPYCGAGYSHSRSFLLHRYVNTLTEFSWTFLSAPDTRFNYTRADTWFGQEPYQVVLPKLQRLQLGLWGFPLSGYFNNISSYVGNHHKTLTALVLQGWMLPMMEFHELVNTIASPTLVELEISLDILCSSAIVQISTNFPKLQVLNLSYNEVGRQIWHPGSHSYISPDLDQDVGFDDDDLWEARMRQFKQDMDVLTLPHWPLDTLYLSGGIRSYRFSSARVGNSMLRSLPRVGFVNGRYREDFLKLGSEMRG